jgi:hypothetical protein
MLMVMMTGCAGGSDRCASDRCERSGRTLPAGIRTGDKGDVLGRSECLAFNNSYHIGKCGRNIKGNVGESDF